MTRGPQTSIGARIRDLRRKAKLSQYELAEMIGAQQHTISKIETGMIPNPPRSTLAAIRRALSAAKKTC